MDNSEHGVAVRHRIHDDPDGDQVINLVKGLMLKDHLPVDRIEMLGPAVDVKMNMLLVQLRAQLIDHLADVLLPFGPLHPDQMDNVVVSVRIQVLQAQILEILLQRINAQPVRKRGIDVQRFPRDGLLAVRRLIAEGIHIVKPVRQLDQHDPDVPAHGEDHFPDAFRLRLLPVGEVQLVQLGHAVHQLSHLVIELSAQRVQRDAFAVLHRIMQEARRDGGRIDHEVRQDGRDETGVRKIRLPGFPDLTCVGFFRKLPRMFHQFVAVARVIFLYPVQHLVQRHSFVGCKSHDRNLLSFGFSGQWLAAS